MPRIGINYNLNLIATNMENARYAHALALTPLATGKRINKLRDSPTQLNEYMRLSGEISRKKQYQFNISTARTRVNITDSVLSELDGVIKEAYELGIQGLNGSLSANDLANVTARLNSIDSTILSLGNTKIGSVYLFSGFKSATQPFTGAAGVFNGDTNAVNIKVSATRDVQVSLSGSDLFTGTNGNTDVFDTIDDLITAVGAQDATALGTALTGLQTVMTKIQTDRSSMGNSIKQLEAAGDFLNNLEVANSERLSTIGDTDVASATSELSYREFSMKSAIAVAQRVMEISLQSFLQ